MGGQLYEIQDGVRRAKAAWLCGPESIPAQIDGENEIIQVPIFPLLSPKLLIEDRG